MTFSVLLRDPTTGEIGGAVASKFLAAGSSVLHVVAGVGAVATQASANISFGPRGLRLLAEGLSSELALTALLDGDPGAARRQVALLGASTGADAYTGLDCMAVACHLAGDAYSCQGNVLASPQVVEAMAAAASAHEPGRPLLGSLLAALEAGDAAGGDRRGRQSAAVRVERSGAGYGGTCDTVIDLRVDDHAAPIPELRRLAELHRELFRRPEPHELMPIAGSVLERVVTALEAVSGEAFDAADERAVWRALDRWAGWENYEEHLVEEMTIDAVLLAALERAASAAT